MFDGATGGLLSSFLPYGSFAGGVQDDGAVKLAFFTDPDGNVLYLVETAH